MSNGLDDLLVLLGRVAVVLEARGQAAGQGAGRDFELVAEVPDADLLAGELARVVDARVLPRHRQRAGALEDLGDVDEVRAGLAGLKDLRNPGDRELRAIRLRSPTACGITSAPPGNHLTVRFSAAK